MHSVVTDHLKIESTERPFATVRVTESNHDGAVIGQVGIFLPHEAEALANELERVFGPFSTKR